MDLCCTLFRRHRYEFYFLFKKRNARLKFIYLQTMKITFVGCSMVAGNGFNPADPAAECKDSPYLWVNLCHKNIDQFQPLTLENLGETGASNTKIFTESVRAISENNRLPADEKIKFMIVAWTAYPRHRIDLGFELYNTELYFKEGIVTDDVKLNNFVWPKRQLEDFIVKFQLAHHPQNGIIELLRYCLILEKLAEAQNIKLYFVNMSCPWDKDYFTKLKGNNIMPNDYTMFTKNEILNVNNRADEEIYQLYDKLHKQYGDVGGINPDAWINLYQPLIKEKIDLAHDGQHAGVASQQIFFQIIKNFFAN